MHKIALTISYRRPAWGGGVSTPPPSVFFAIATKRRCTTPPNLAQLIWHLFRILCVQINPRSLKVRSPGQVKETNLQKSLNSRQSYNDEAIDITPAEIGKSDTTYKTYISDFRRFDINFKRQREFHPLPPRVNAHSLQRCDVTAIEAVFGRRLVLGFSKLKINRKTL